MPELGELILCWGCGETAVAKMATFCKACKQAAAQKRRDMLKAIWKGDPFEDEPASNVAANNRITLPTSKYCGMDWDSLRPDLQAACLPFINDPTSLVLTGSPGTRKTCTGWGVVNMLYGLDRIKSMKFIAADELMEAMTWASDRAFRSVILEYERVEFLFLDDIARNPLTNTMRVGLGALISKRYDNCRTTLYTTNHVYPALCEQVGEGVASRIFSGHSLVLEGKDERLKH